MDRKVLSLDTGHCVSYLKGDMMASVQMTHVPPTPFYLCRNTHVQLAGDTSKDQMQFLQLARQDPTI